MYRKELNSAKKNKNDEFYTQLSDIEKELKYYKDYFRDKVVFLNCDDPYESNFFKYFAMNFNHLGLRKLISTSYDNSLIAYDQISIFEIETLEKQELESGNTDKRAYKVIINYVEDFNKDGVIDLEDIEFLIKHEKNVFELLEGDGDFRSKECVDLLKISDIVVTNPPFSLFRTYVNQLFQYKKDFLIIGNQNAITYREVFPLIMKNEIWLGISMNGSNRYFRVPDDYPLTEKTGKIENGKKYAFVKSVVWFTNIKNKKWTDKLTLSKKYNEEDYQTYDNYPAIDVGKVSDIPADYNGVMGVPITFLHKYNPTQFRIVGLGNSRENFQPSKTYKSPIKVLKDGTERDGGAINSVLTIRVVDKPVDTVYYYDKAEKNYLLTPYARILIERIL